MIDPDALLNDLKPQVRALENDLRDRAGEEPFDVPLRAEWDKAVRRNRTAATYETWLEDQVTQSAVAWVLSTVFLRFCEDNRLIDDVFLSGRGERLDLAKERQQHFFEQPKHASETDREWIVEGLDAMAKASPVAAGLFDRDHNPMWRITPSLEGAKALIDFWRRTRPALPDEGLDVAAVPVHDFTDPKWNTRFLGNLYQDLSEHAKKKYALLQTPEFVEEFILGLTLDEAINEFGLDPEPPEACPEELNLPRGLRVIDPTCGSGHFLLGAFEHLVDKLQATRPYDDKWDVVQRALYSVHGVDKNPFAVAIARFRMLIAAMQAGEVKRLKDAPDFTLNIAVGDSLIHGRGGPDLDQGRWEFDENGELAEPEPVFTYATEDISDYVKTVDLLGVGSYHVVVGNPPYITVKDKTENKNYRVYKSCSGTYALSVPFTERFFQLAIRAGQDRRGAGYVGQITANSFMKREFGKKLIEEFFPTIRLTHVIDTSGAHIPGHGTPTAIMIGRRTYPREEPIRTALSVRGEPTVPADARDGFVWQAILHQIGNPGSESPWLSVMDSDRMQFTHHPWSLSGGGALQLKQAIEKVSGVKRLAEWPARMGVATTTGDDDAFLVPPSMVNRWPNLSLHIIVEGDEVRDYSITSRTYSVFPYSKSLKVLPLSSDLLHWFWPNRRSLQQRRRFSVPIETIEGIAWYEYRELYRSKLTTPLTIVFCTVATHNHFVLDRGGKVFNRHAPVVKLPKKASKDEHLALLGILNSSTACFWLKQVCQDKGNRGGERSTGRYAWENFFEFTGTKLQEFPIPPDLPISYGEELDAAAQELESVQPHQICVDSVPSRKTLDEARRKCTELQGKLVSLQEELDWQVYRSYGLLTQADYDRLHDPANDPPRIYPGERAFEISIAKDVANDEAAEQWFKRHHSTPLQSIPEHWPESYREIVRRRIEAIESRKDIRLLERPECKRRWEWDSWEKSEEDALRHWLLGQCERREWWFSTDEIGQDRPRMITVGRLADRLQDDADFVSVARLYAGEDVELIDVLKDILDAEHVPFIPAYRYKDSGLRKRAQWEETWRLQRQEDETGERLDIKVPPKYTSADFVKNSYWRNRGKLDVPKERFISYPDASPDGDDTLLLGWAGWDHAQQAHALVTLIEERTTRDGWELERLMPLLAGLDEVLPWVKQWYSEVDPDTGLSPAVAYEGYLQEQVEKYPGLSREELAKWRPPKKTRGRGARKKKADE